MARPIWKGNISFGLVNIPVVLQSAERRKELSFKLLDSRNHAGIHYQRINDKTGQEVPWDKIVKGYEYEDGNYVLLTDNDFKKAAVEATQTIEILDFVDEGEIEPLYFEKPYYLLPGKKGEKGYVLLRETLERSGKVGIGRVVIRTREYLAAVMARDKTLILELLRFANELVKADDLETPGKNLKQIGVTDKEIDMARKLVDAMSGEWHPEKYHDQYRDSLMKWIEAKARSGGKEPVFEREQEEEEDRKGIINIMDLLKKSVEKTGGTKRKTAATRAHRKEREAPRRKRA